MAPRGRRRAAAKKKAPSQSPLPMSSPPASPPPQLDSTLSLDTPLPVSGSATDPGLLGLKRPASEVVSFPAVSRALLMRSQLTSTPVAKRTAALPPRLSRLVCLRCSKRIDKVAHIVKKGKGIGVGSGCVKVANRKCEYCAI
jgi:hypothetical protein